MEQRSPRPGLVDALQALNVATNDADEHAGSSTPWVANFAPVSEHLTPEQSLRQLENLQRSTLDLLEQGVVVLHRAGTVELMNAAASRILGFNAAELTTQWQTGNWRTYHEDGSELDFDERPVVRVIRDGERIDSMVIAWERRNGQRVMVSVSTSLIPDDPDRVMITFTDVTERRRDRQLLDLTFSNAPIGMALVRHDGRFLAVNDSLCTLLGRSEQELLSTTFHDVTHPDDLEADVANAQRLLDGHGDRYDIEKRYVRPDGEVVHAQLAVAIVRTQTLTQPYFVSQVIDIGDRIEAAQATHEALMAEREAVTKLVELDRIRSTFVSTISHELRTPLASLIGYLELLDDDVPPLATHQSKMVEIADRNAHRLLHLIENLLSIAQIEHDPHPAERHAVSLTHVLGRAIETIRPLANDSGLTLNVDLDPRVRTVHGDANQLERMALNLLSNAVKFTPAGGAINVRLEQRETDLQLTVTDTGLGISQSEMTHLFTQFFRSSTAVENDIPGTGLGLAISSRIIESHGGTIVAASGVSESGSGQPYGTTFVVTLPTTTAHAAVNGASPKLTENRTHHTTTVS